MTRSDLSVSTHGSDSSYSMISGQTSFEEIDKPSDDDSSLSEVLVVQGVASVISGLSGLLFDDQRSTGSVVPHAIGFVKGDAVEQVVERQHDDEQDSKQQVSSNKRVEPKNASVEQQLKRSGESSGYYSVSRGEHSSMVNRPMDFLNTIDQKILESCRSAKFQAAIKDGALLINNLRDKIPQETSNFDRKSPPSRDGR